VVPSPIDLVDSIFHKKRKVMSKRVFPKSMKDHLIPHIVEKATAKDMYDALVGPYQNKNIGRMLQLKHRI
jgi:hypothetical protein